MNINPISVGDFYIMPLNAKVSQENMTPVLADPVVSDASVISFTPLEAVTPQATPEIGATIISAGLFEPMAGAVTITISTPAVVTKVAHGLVDDQAVMFSTTGALPTGITVGTIYYTNYTTVNTFEISLYIGGGTVNTSGAQSGVHTLLYRTVSI